MSGSENKLKLTSPVFNEGEEIPSQYTCKGENVNPPLNILGVPPQAKSLALIMHDPDAVNGDFTHWILWDIPTSTKSIAPNSSPVGAIQGLNSANRQGYLGPCPPAGTGTHRYMFELYALGKPLTRAAELNRHQLESAISDSAISKSTLTGLFSAD